MSRLNLHDHRASAQHLLSQLKSSVGAPPSLQSSSSSSSSYSSSSSLAPTLSLTLSELNASVSSLGRTASDHRSLQQRQALEGEAFKLLASKDFDVMHFASIRDFEEATKTRRDKDKGGRSQAGTGDYYGGGGDNAAAHRRPAELLAGGGSANSSSSSNVLLLSSDLRTYLLHHHDMIVETLGKDTRTETSRRATEAVRRRQADDWKAEKLRLLRDLAGRRTKGWNPAMTAATSSSATRTRTNDRNGAFGNGSGGGAAAGTTPGLLDATTDRHHVSFDASRTGGMIGNRSLNDVLAGGGGAGTGGAAGGGGVGGGGAGLGGGGGGGTAVGASPFHAGAWPRELFNSQQGGTPFKGSDNNNNDSSSSSSSGLTATTTATRESRVCPLCDSSVIPSDASSEKSHFYSCPHSRLMYMVRTWNEHCRDSKSKSCDPRDVRNRGNPPLAVLQDRVPLLQLQIDWNYERQDEFGAMLAAVTFPDDGGPNSGGTASSSSSSFKTALELLSYAVGARPGGSGGGSGRQAATPDEAAFNVACGTLTFLGRQYYTDVIERANTEASNGRTVIPSKGLGVEATEIYQYVQLGVGARQGGYPPGGGGGGGGGPAASPNLWTCVYEALRIADYKAAEDLLRAAKQGGSMSFEGGGDRNVDIAMQAVESIRRLVKDTMAGRQMGGGGGAGAGDAANRIRAARSAAEDVYNKAKSNKAAAAHHSVMAGGHQNEDRLSVFRLLACCDKQKPRRTDEDGGDTNADYLFQMLWTKTGGGLGSPNPNNVSRDMEAWGTNIERNANIFHEVEGSFSWMYVINLLCAQRFESALLYCQKWQDKQSRHDFSLEAAHLAMVLGGSNVLGACDSSGNRLVADLIRQYSDRLAERDPESALEYRVYLSLCVPSQLEKHSASGLPLEVLTYVYDLVGKHSYHGDGAYSVVTGNLSLNGARFGGRLAAYFSLQQVDDYLGKCAEEFLKEGGAVATHNALNMFSLAGRFTQVLDLLINEVSTRLDGGVRGGGGEDDGHRARWLSIAKNFKHQYLDERNDNTRTSWTLGGGAGPRAAFGTADSGDRVITSWPFVFPNAPTFPNVGGALVLNGTSVTVGPQRSLVDLVRALNNANCGLTNCFPVQFAIDGSGQKLLLKLGDYRPSEVSFVRQSLKHDDPRNDTNVRPLTLDSLLQLSEFFDHYRAGAYASALEVVRGVRTLVDTRLLPGCSSSGGGGGGLRNNDSRELLSAVDALYDGKVSRVVVHQMYQVLPAAMDCLYHCHASKKRELQEMVARENAQSRGLGGGGSLLGLGGGIFGGGGRSREAEAGVELLYRELGELKALAKLLLDFTTMIHTLPKETASTVANIEARFL